MIFSPVDAGGVVGFCVAHGSPFDAPLLRRLLLDLTSDAAGVFVLQEGDGEAAVTVLAATLIDRTINETGAAVLEVLGVRRLIDAPAFLALVVGPAAEKARAGGFRTLRVPLRPALVGVEEAARALRAAGFVLDVTSLEMIRSAAAGAGAPAEPEPEPLAAGWRWAPLDDDRAEQAHAGLIEMFHGARTFGLSPLPAFRRAIASRVSTWRLLLDGARRDRLVGLVHVAMRGDRGEVRTVGRAPAYRGRGVGAHLVAEGLRLLRASGARELALDVEAENEPALILYRRFGFEVAARVPMFALTLRS